MSKDDKRTFYMQKFFGADNLQISQHVDRSSEEVVQLQARCNEFWRHLGPTQYARDKRYLFPGKE